MSSSEAELSRREPVVRLKSISKEFPGVLAVDGVDLEILSGEVHVVAGENGAGKSTLLRYGAGAGRDRGGRHRGASLFGGQGTVVGTLIGAFLIALILNSAVLLDVNTFYQQVIIGVVIWLAVFWDQYRAVGSPPRRSRNVKEKGGTDA